MGEPVKLNEVEELWVTSNYSARPPTPADLLAAVRRGVESGTIKGAEVWRCAASPSRTVPCDKRHGWQEEDNPECEWVLVIPVSDGGSET